MEPVLGAGVGGLNGDAPGRGVVGVPFDAVILAGGRASRLGGYPKSLLVFEGATLLERALGAVRGARLAVVVGPRLGESGGRPASVPEAPGIVDDSPDRSPYASRQVRYVLEEPRYGGPVAALGAGLTALGGGHPDDDGAPWVAVLAVDVPRVADALAILAAAATSAPDVDAIVAEDDGGRLQPLLGLYRRGPLEQALADLAEEGGLADRPMRHLVARLALQPLRLPPGLVDDVDTWSAADGWGIRRPEGPGTPSEPEEPEMPESAPDAESAAQPAATEGKQPDVDAILRAWSAELVDALELDGLEVDIDAVLALAGVAAHAVVRPAAPLTTFLAAYAAGYAAGSGRAGEKAAMESAIDVARRLAKSRAEQAGPGE